jgi:hypothetical protein
MPTEPRIDSIHFFHYLLSNTLFVEDNPPCSYRRFFENRFSVKKQERKLCYKKIILRYPVEFSIHQQADELFDMSASICTPLSFARIKPLQY